MTRPDADRFNPGGFIAGRPDSRFDQLPPPPGEPPEITRGWGRMREILAPAVQATLRQMCRDRYIARLRYLEHTIDTHGRIARVSVVWDNPFSQEDHQ